MRGAGVEPIWAKAFNSFGFIALLVCIAVLLTTIASSFADQHRVVDADDLLLLPHDAAMLIEIQAALPVATPAD